MLKKFYIFVSNINFVILILFQNLCPNRLTEIWKFMIHKLSLSVMMCHVLRFHQVQSYVRGAFFLFGVVTTEINEQFPGIILSGLHILLFSFKSGHSKLYYFGIFSLSAPLGHFLSPRCYSLSWNQRTKCCFFRNH